MGWYNSAGANILHGKEYPLMKKAVINVTVKTISQPDPARLVEMWAQIIFKEISRMEPQERKSQQSSEES